MFTLAIIAVVFFIAWLLTDTDYSGLAITAISLGVLAVVSSGVSCTNVPDGYTEVDSVSYMTKAGYIETLDECDYYTDGTDYYEQNTDKANWVPFAPAEYVKVELPGTVVAWGTEDKVVSGQVETPERFCANCGNELGEGDKFCTGCGAKAGKP